MVQHEGCVDCGTEWSTGWHPLPDRQIEVTFTASRCADCQRKRDLESGPLLPLLEEKA